MPTLVLRPRALTDLAEIWAYIAEDSPDRADAFVDLVDSKLQTLSRRPGLGRRGQSYIQTSEVSPSVATSFSTCHSLAESKSFARYTAPATLSRYLQRTSEDKNASCPTLRAFRKVGFHDRAHHKFSILPEGHDFQSCRASTNKRRGFTR